MNLRAGTRAPHATGFAALGVLAFLWASSAFADASKLRLLPLDFELVDTSGEPIDQTADHARRLEAARDRVASEASSRGAYELVGREKIADELAALLKTTYLRTCNGCELALARRAGADLVMTGQIFKASSLILAMKVWIKNARTGDPVFYQTFDFRGDNDESWRRTAKYIGARLAEHPPGLSRE